MSQASPALDQPALRAVVMCEMADDQWPVTDTLTRTQGLQREDRQEQPSGGGIGSPDKAD